MTDTLAYFTVTDALYEYVGTDVIDTDTNAPTVNPISGLVTFTPCDALGKQITEIDSEAIDATIMLDPIVGRFSVDTPGGEPDGMLRAVGGTAGVQLVDNVNLGLDAGGLTYRVDYSDVVFDNIGQRHINTFWFTAPGDGDTIDLNSVTRLHF